jgi:hypothetical protein
MKKMYRKLMLVVALAAALALMISPVYAKGNSGQAGNSNVAHLYLDPFGDIPLESNAWGKVKYNLSGATLDFVFNGHQLTPGQYYAIYSKGQPLGVAMANEFGDVHIKGSFGMCEDVKIEGGRFNLWSVVVVVDDEYIVETKKGRILWSEKNDFVCVPEELEEE